MAKQRASGALEPRAESERERIGVLGGTFDPVHYAHLAIAEEVYHALRLARVVFVPAGQPPHKMGYRVTPVEQRVHMLEQAIAPNPHFALSLVDVRRAGPSYTVDTLRLLRSEWGPRAEFFFVIGGDSLRDLPSWHDPAGVIAQATIVALVRPGYGELERYGSELAERLPGIEERLITLEGPHMEISSTDLRQRVFKGRPIKYQTPEIVEHYILQHGLYRASENNSSSSRQAFARAEEEGTQGREQRDAHATNAI
ncbi:MAG TPA: nicotinate-nucleotide adenylyltransferase [Ktedonobacteraceae bacterium]